MNIRLYVRTEFFFYHPYKFCIFTTMAENQTGTCPVCKSSNRRIYLDLAWLAQMVAEQKLKTPIEVEASWHEIGNVAQRLLQRQFTGKAVLHLGK
jgi:hypothetical protein